MRKIVIDFETRSEVDIKKVGGWAYAMHPTTEILCLGIGLQENLRTTLIPYKSFGNKNLISQIERILGQEPFQLIAHSAHFEYAVWNCILYKKYGWPKLLDPKNWGCTQARGAMCAFPLSLENMGKALNLVDQKQVIKGRTAMQKLCKPQTPAIQKKTGQKWCNDPKVFEDLYEYCVADVVSEMELDRTLPELPPIERKVWEADLIINRRGIKIDVPAVREAKRFAEEFTEEYNGKLFKLTGGAVEKATRVAGMKRWIVANSSIEFKPPKPTPAKFPIKDELFRALKGWEKLPGVDGLDKLSVTKLIEDKSTPQNVSAVLDIRRKVGKSSVSKYKTMMICLGYMDRLRGTLQYHAARTGRWGGRLSQPQNFPKGTLSPEEAELTIGLMETHGLLDFGPAFTDPMKALSSCLRGMFISEEGKDFLVVDYSSIEARVLLWSANDAFALTKYKMGIDLYVDMAATIYDKNKKVVTKKERDLGKTTILGSGYGMGWETFMKRCRDEDISKSEDVNVSEDINISEEMSKHVIKTYRAKYKTVVNMWYAQEATAIKAIQSPGTSFTCGKIVWGMDASRRFLACRLPSGRHLLYFKPFIKTVTTPWGTEKPEIHFIGEDSVTKRWGEMKTYGGSLVENMVQAIARDIMASAILKCEAAGYPIVLSVHDELIAEVFENDKTKTLEKFVELMCDLPAWAKGCPITADGWRGKRYRK